MHEISQGLIMTWRTGEKQWLLREGESVFSSDKPCIGYPGIICQSETHVHKSNTRLILIIMKRGHSCFMELERRVRWPTNVNYSPKDHGTNKRNTWEFSKSSIPCYHFYCFNSHKFSACHRYILKYVIYIIKMY